MTAIRTLLEGLIDYAGFAPPAALPMAAAVRNYAAYREGEYARALGRFVVPAERLAEFEATARECSPFRLSVLSLPGPVAHFHSKHFVEAVEIKPVSPKDIAATMNSLL
jgi:hypothetical protein